MPSSLVLYGVTALSNNLINSWNQHHNRQQAEQARWEQQALTRELEGSRREMQKEQMKLSILHQHSNQAHQRALAIDNQKFQAILQQQNHQFQREIEEFRQRVNLAINDRNLNFQKWRFEQQKQLQLHIVELNQQFQQEMVATQHQNAKELIYESYRENKESPIINLLKDLIDAPFNSNGVMPIKIFFSPPELDYDFNQPKSSKVNSESYLAEGIRQFINQDYSINSQERPTEFLDKAWLSKSFGGGSALNILYKNLKPIPVIVFESEIAMNGLNLRYCSWDGSETPRVEGSLLTDFPFIDFIKQSAKARAKELRQEIVKIRQAGLSDEGIGEKEDRQNIAILEQEEKAIAEINNSQFSTKEKTKYIQQKQKYYLSKYLHLGNDEKAFYNYLVVWHCLTIGIVTDLQALQRSCQNSPLLPKLLPSLLDRLKLSSQENQQAIAEIVKLYHQFCEGLSKQAEYNSLVPDVALDLALALCDLEDKSFAMKEVSYSVAQWLDLHGIELGKVFDPNNNIDCELFVKVICEEDKKYLTKLRSVVKKNEIEKDFGWKRVFGVLNVWNRVKDSPDGEKGCYDYVYQGDCYFVSKNYSKAITKYKTALLLHPPATKNSKVYNNLGQASYYIEEYQNAVEYYTKAIELANFSNSYSLHYNRAMAYYRLDKYQEVITDINTTFKLNNNFNKAYFLRAKAYYELEQYDLAIIDYSNAIKSYSNFSKAYFERGKTYAELKQYHEAIADYNRVLELKNLQKLTLKEVKLTKS